MENPHRDVWGSGGKNKGPEMATPFLRLLPGSGNGLAQHQMRLQEPEPKVTAPGLWEEGAEQQKGSGYRRPSNK